MTDRPEPLDQLLSDAAARVVPPDVAARDDLARGRRHVRRQRLGLGLTALAAVAAVGVGAVLVGGGGTDPGADDAPVASDPAPSTTPSASPTPGVTHHPVPAPDQRDGKELLQDYRDVLAEHLDPSGTHLDRLVTNVQGSGRGIGTKLGWTNDGESGLGMVEVFVSPSMRSQFNLFCDSYTPCDHVTLGGVDAIVQESDGVTIVAVERVDGSVVALQVDTLFGNNSTVPVSGIDISKADLARTAADERLTVPTKEQVDGVNEAFGWPDPSDIPGVRLR